jgi:transposase
MVLQRQFKLVMYLPPYSPDWLPIEPCWSKLDAYSSSIKAHTRDARDKALTCAINLIRLRMRMEGTPVAAMPYINTQTALVSL